MEEVFSEVNKIKEKQSQVGNIFANRNISKEAIKGTMGKIGRLCQPAFLMETRKNVFNVTFATIADISNVCSTASLGFLRTTFSSFRHWMDTVNSQNKV